jgi:hypothetical protein
MMKTKLWGERAGGGRPVPAKIEAARITYAGREKRKREER